MPYILTTGPTAEPLSLAEAKLHLRVDIADDDTLISAMISAARQHAEMVMQRQIVAATWKLAMDAFPGPSLIGVPAGVPLSVPGHAVLLNKSPVFAINSIRYLDMASAWQTMPSTADATANTITAALWKPLAVGDAVRFSNSGGALPAPLEAMTDYYVQAIVSPGVYALATAPGGPALDLTTAGTGTSFIGEIPEAIKAWLKIRVNRSEENREQFVMAGRGAHVEPMPY